MLSILGLVAIFIITYFVYKSAKEYGRNAIGWAVITLCLGFGLQIVIPFLIVVVVAIFMSINGKSAQQVEEYAQSFSFLLGTVPLIISLVVIGLILKYVGKMPEEKTFISPPEPPTFN